MTGKQDHWMPLYIADYLADTMHLSTEEHGAYLLLIMHYWRNGGPIKNDKIFLKKITKISEKKLKNILEFFEEKDGYLHHKRIDNELAKAVENKEKQRKRTEAATLARTQRNDNVTFTPSPSPISSSLRSEGKKEITNVISKERKSRKPKISFEELSIDHIRDWLAEKRSEGRYLQHDENFILEYFRNYCQSNGKAYNDYVAALRNAFEWDACQPGAARGKYPGNGFVQPQESARRSEKQRGADAYDAIIEARNNGTYVNPFAAKSTPHSQQSISTERANNLTQTSISHSEGLR